MALSVSSTKGFIVKDNRDWEIDSLISLDLADSLDHISDFEEELKSVDSDSLSEISIPSATYYDSDNRDYGEGTSAAKKKKAVKERNLQRNLNRGEEMISAQNNQSSQLSIPVKPVQRRRRGSNKITNKKESNLISQSGLFFYDKSFPLVYKIAFVDETYLHAQRH